MDTPTALFLGFLQGLTEFLPVSSSGHLVLAETALGIVHRTPLLFDLILHLATLLAVGVYFRAKIFELCMVLWNWRITGDDAQDNKSILIAIAISTVVTSVIGLGFKKLPVIEDVSVIDLMREQPVLVGWALLFTGTVLFSTFFRQGNQTDGTIFPISMIWFGILLGLAQGIATLPGVSRSGMTVCTALLLGSSKKMALEYSFIMSIPVIILASLFEMREGFGSMAVLPVIVGFVTSLVFSYIFLTFLSWLTRKGKLYQFGFYTVPAGIYVLFAF